MFKASVVALDDRPDGSSPGDTIQAGTSRRGALGKRDVCAAGSRRQSHELEEHVRFLGRGWALEFVQFADDRCMRPTMKAFLTGQYQITEPSSVVPMAHDATFGFSQKAVTLYDQSLHCRSQPRV